MTDKEMFEYLVNKVTRIEESQPYDITKHPYDKDFDSKKFSTVDIRINGLVFDKEGSVVQSWAEYD